MTAKVTSIVGPRSRARRRDSEVVVTRRIVTLLVVPMVVLLVVGLGAILSASSVRALAEDHSSVYYFARQLIWALGGGAALFVTARIPYDLYRRTAPVILAVSVLSLVAVLLFGVTRGGSRSWLEVGSITIQPSEFAKFAVVVFLSMVMARKRELLTDFAHFFWPVAASLGVVGGLTILQPDLGTTIIIGAGALAVLVASEAPFRFVAGSAAGGGLAALVLAMAADYRWDRVTGFLDPFSDPLGSGFQGVQSLFALGTGGFFGVGLGASRARWEFLPNAHTDFIYAIIGEETGLIGAGAVLILLAVFTLAGVAVAIRARDDFGRMLATGIVAWLAVQAIVNLGGVTAILPITGLPLPFVSFGGSALLVEMAAVGILINIARRRPPTRSRS
ncbi:MAG: putative lipid II flippase FtsW [Acidimicrobiia bacterium]|nr:putative lipid II flippase FtsW [Acidimicrobiia bacterium]